MFISNIGPNLLMLYISKIDTLILFLSLIFVIQHFYIILSTLFLTFYTLNFLFFKMRYKFLYFIHLHPLHMKC